jgi:hypothetical protein
MCYGRNRVNFQTALSISKLRAQTQGDENLPPLSRGDLRIREGLHRSVLDESG